MRSAATIAKAVTTSIFASSATGPGKPYTPTMRLSRGVLDEEGSEPDSQDDVEPGVGGKGDDAEKNRAAMKVTTAMAVMLGEKGRLP